METVDSATIHYATISMDKTLQIENIASNCKTKFSSAKNFVRESLGLYILWWTEPEVVMEQAKTWYPHMTEEQIDYLKKRMRNPKAKNPDEMFEKEVQEVINRDKPYLQPLPFESTKPGELRIDIDFGTFRAIQKIINEGDAKKRYHDWESFFQEAISLFVLWWTPGESESAEQVMYSIWPYIPKKIKEHWENHDKFGPTFKNFIGGRNIWCKKNNIDPDALPDITSAESKQIESIVEEKQVQEFVAPTVSEEPISTQQLRAATKAQDSWNLLCAELEDTKSYIDGMQIPSKIPADSLPSDDYPLIWSFYSRFLPVKIVMTALADMISDTQTEMVNYKHFREIAYEASLGLAEILKQYETKWKIKRNEKLSTGLPLATFGLDMTNMEKQAKVKASKERFLEHFVGMKKESWVKRQNDEKSKKKNGLAFFDGALNAMGLVYFKAEKIEGGPSKSNKKKTEYEIKIGLTRLGADLVGLGNPILENYQREHWKNALADGEIEFLFNEIIPKFPLEHKLVNKTVNMLNVVQEKSSDNYLIPKNLNTEFDTIIREWLQKNNDNSYFNTITKIRSDAAMITPWRVATMGRLGEMKIADWKLEKGTGKSRFYPHQSLTEKISQLFKKVNN
jgi:hypothetical protein